MHLSRLLMFTLFRLLSLRIVFFRFLVFKINYRTALHKFLKVNERIPSSEDYTLSEALYTFEGSSSMVLGTVSALRI